MNREQLKKLGYTPDSDCEVKENGILKIVVEVGSIYNKAIEAHRPSVANFPLDYQMKYLARLSQIKQDTLNSFENNEKITEKVNKAIEKNKTVKELLKRNIPCNVNYEVIPSNVCVNGEPHHWREYIIFKFEVDNDVLIWDSNRFCRKVLIYVEDGLFEIKIPPFNLKGDCYYDYGMKVYNKETVLVS